MGTKATRAEKNAWMKKMLENTKLTEEELIKDFMLVFSSTRITAREVFRLMK